MRHFINPYHDYQQQPVSVDKNFIGRLIDDYVTKIIHYTTYNEGDVYVGTSGIAFMFLKIHES